MNIITKVLSLNQVMIYFQYSISDQVIRMHVGYSFSLTGSQTINFAASRAANSTRLGPIVYCRGKKNQTFLIPAPLWVLVHIT